MATSDEPSMSTLVTPDAWRLLVLFADGDLALWSLPAAAPWEIPSPQMALKATAPSPSRALAVAFTAFLVEHCGHELINKSLGVGEGYSCFSVSASASLWPGWGLIGWLINGFRGQ